MTFAVDDGGPGEAHAVALTFSDRTGRSLGRRLFSFDGSSCDAALEAAAVALALFLQDHPATADLADRRQNTVVAGAEAPPAPVTPPSRAPSVDPPAPAVTARSAAVPTGSAGPVADWSVAGRAGLLIEGGDVPWGTWGAEATFRARRSGWPELFAGGMFWPEQRFVSQGVGMSWTRASARVGLCPVQLRWESRALAGCAAFDGGRLVLDPTGLIPSYRQDRWTAGADAALALLQRVEGGWSVGLEARLIVPFLRNRVDVADDAGNTRNLFRASPVGAAGVLSIGYSPGSSSMSAGD